MNKKGYTIIEVLLTIAVVGILMVPVMQFFTNSIEIGQKSRRQVKAAYIAQDYLEMAKVKAQQGKTLDETALVDTTVNETEGIYDISITYMEDNGTLKSSDEIKFGDSSVDDSDLTINVSKDGIKVENEFEKKSDNRKYTLKISGTGEDYQLQFTYLIGEEILLIPFIDVKKDNVDDPITAKAYVVAAGLDDTYLTINNECDRPFNIYIYDDENNNFNVDAENNFGNSDVNIISNLNSDEQDSINLNNIYRIKVDVSIDGKVLETLESFVNVK